MNKIKIRRVYQGNIYNITIEKTGNNKLIVDDVVTNGNVINPPKTNKEVSVYYSY